MILRRILFAKFSFTHHGILNVQVSSFEGSRHNLNTKQRTAGEIVTAGRRFRSAQHKEISISLSCAYKVLSKLAGVEINNTLFYITFLFCILWYSYGDSLYSMDTTESMNKYRISFFDL